MKNLIKTGIFKDPADASIKCVFEVERKYIEMTLLQNRDDTDVICVPTHHFCSLGCKMCHLTNNSLNKCSTPITYEYFREALGNTICNQNTLVRRSNKKKLLVSFMGVGEPTLNFDLISQLNSDIEELKREFGYEKIGLAMATMMPTDAFRKITTKVYQENIPLKVHFSMHSPKDAVRSDLIPASKNSVKECLDMLKEYADTISSNKKIMENFSECHRTGDLVEIHYTLIDGVNDSDEDLALICNYLREYGFTIKFIRFNPKEDMYISTKEEQWVNTIKNETSSRVKTYCPPGKNVGSSCGEFTKHYYHEEIETEEQRKEFLYWKSKYEISD